MHADRCGRAVINEKPGVERLEGKLRRMPRRGERRSRAAARPGDGVQVNVVRQLAVRRVVQMEFHIVAHADADETAGHVAAKSPKRVIHAVRQPFRDFLHFEMHDDFGRVLALDGRRHAGRLRQQGGFLADGLGIGGFDGLVRGIGSQRRAAQQRQAQAGGAQRRDKASFHSDISCFDLDY